MHPETSDIPLPRQIEVPPHLSVPGTSGAKLLAIERSKASFSSSDLANFLIGPEHLERQARLLSIIEKEPAFNKRALPYLSRQDKFAVGFAKEKRFVQLSREHSWSEQDAILAASFERPRCRPDAAESPGLIRKN